MPHEEVKINKWIFLIRIYRKMIAVSKCETLGVGLKILSFPEHADMIKNNILDWIGFDFIDPKKI